MKLTPELKQLLQNFSDINKQLYVQANQPLSTVNESTSVLGYADISDKFTSTFGIYDLSDFLSVHDLLDKPELVFSENYLTLKDGPTKVKYQFAAESTLTYPTKTVSVSNPEVVLSLSAAQISKIKKAASVLKAPTLNIRRGDGNTLILSVVNHQIPSSNSFSMEIESNVDLPDKEFSLDLSIGLFTFLNYDYELEVSFKFVSKWTAKNAPFPLTYFVSLDKTTKIG